MPAAPTAPAQPKVDLVARLLRERIVQGRMATGTKIASHARLAREFGVSGITAQMAVGRLRQEGFIETRPRSGTYVSARLPHLTNHAMVFWNDPSVAWQWTRYYQALMTVAQSFSG